MPTQSHKSEIVSTLKYASKYGVGVIIPGILSFFFIPLVVQLFDVSVFAKFSIVQNATNLFVLFSFGWLNQGIIRFYSKYQNSDEFISAVYRLFLISSLAGVFASIFLFIFLQLSLFASILVFFIFIFTGLYSILISIKQANVKPVTIMILEIIRTLLLISLPYFSIKNSWQIDQLVTLLSALFISFLVPILFDLKILLGVLNHTVKQKPFAIFRKRLFNYGYPITIFLGISLALNVSDRFIIAQILDYDLSGKYAALYDIIGKSVTMACAPILMAFFPAITNQYNARNYGKVKRLLFTAIFAELAIFLIIFSVIYFFGGSIFSKLFSGKIDLEIIKLAIPIFFGIALWQFAMLIHKPLELKQKTIQLAIGVSIAFTVNIIANWYFIKLYQSVTPAAYCTIGSSIVYLVYMYVSDRKFWNYSTNVLS